jgi:hypothetical protein
MTDAQNTPTAGISRSSLIVGGIALTIVVVVFIVLGLTNGSDPNATAHDESVPHSHDADGNPVPVVAGDQPHDDSVPHTHAPKPTPAPPAVPPGEPHDESVPHSH